MSAPESGPATISIALPSEKNRILPLVKWAGVIAGTLLLVYHLYTIYHYYTVRMQEEHFSTLTIVAQHVYIFKMLAIPIMAILILLKSRHNTAFYLALCFIVYEINVSLPLSKQLGIQLADIFTTSLAGLLAVLSFEHFPKKVTPQNIRVAVRFKWLQRYLIFLLNPIALCLGFFSLLIAICVIQTYVLFTGGITDFLIMITAFMYLYVNFRTTSGKDNDQILWLFWGLGSFILTSLIWNIITLFTTEVPDIPRLLLSIANSLILVFSLGMSLFFTDAFDTGKFITRTLVSGFVFVLAILVYNTAEHYILHWFAHTLHISNVMMASFLSGVIVLVISPLHHRLTHFLEKRLRKKGEHETTH